MAHNDKVIRLTDADKQVDFTKVIQGHVSQNIKQVFQIERTRRMVDKNLLIEAAENIVKDQFGNLYVVFIAKLMDGELYACTAWVGAEKWTGTQKTIVLVKEWKKFKRFSDELLTHFQSMAMFSFAKTNLAILKGAQAAKKLINVPTHQEMGVAGAN